MKKDVNFVFFILIIATVVSFAGFTAYYQISFRNINEEYDTKLSELNKVTTDLFEKKSILLQTTTELNTTKKGREELGTQYDTLKEEKDVLQDERDTLKENLYQTRTELAQKKTQVVALSAQVVAVQSEADRWEDKYKDCNDELDACEDTVCT